MFQMWIWFNSTYFHKKYCHTNLLTIYVQLLRAEVEERRLRNIVEHHDEIMARPARQWIQTSKVGCPVCNFSLRIIYYLLPDDLHSLYWIELETTNKSSLSKPLPPFFLEKINGFSSERITFALSSYHSLEYVQEKKAASELSKRTHEGNTSASLENVRREALVRKLEAKQKVNTTIEVAITIEMYSRVRSTWLSPSKWFFSISTRTSLLLMWK